jgi:AAA domain
VAGDHRLVHYCQRCDVAVAMSPVNDEVARCPACGASRRARRRPLFVVTGASGAGKTTVHPCLVDALPECAVFDVDYLLDSLGKDDWRRFRDAWLSVAHGVAQAGRATVLCAPFIPEHLADLPARRWIGDLHFAVLDCPDDVLRRRIDARPRWRERNIQAHVEFGRWLRANINYLVPTVGREPCEVAEDLAGWVRSILPPPSA